MTLATLNTFYALTLGYAQAGLIERAPTGLLQKLYPVAVVLGLSFVVGALMALALRSALRVMSPTSENTSILLLAIIARRRRGGGAPGRLGAAGGADRRRAAQAAQPQALGLAAPAGHRGLAAHHADVRAGLDRGRAGRLEPAGGQRGAGRDRRARLLAKIAGVAIANPGSGASWKQALWLGCAMSPLSSVALLIASNFVTASPLLGTMITQIALPAILLMEVLGAVLATVAIHAAGESSKPWLPEAFGSRGGHAAMSMPARSTSGRRLAVTPASRIVPLEPFNKSVALSLGVELELQLVNTHDYDLAPYAEDMLRLMAQTPLPGSVVPEMTSSMIEISTGICHSARTCSRSSRRSATRW